MSENDLDALLKELAEWDPGELLAGLDVDLDALLDDLASFDPGELLADLDIDALLADVTGGDSATF